MLTFLIILTVIVVALSAANGHVPPSALMARRPYNNRYSDASAARDDWR